MKPQAKIKASICRHKIGLSILLIFVTIVSAFSSDIDISLPLYTTGATFQYLCTDQSAIASVSGLNKNLPSTRCCDKNGSGMWSLTETTYYWSGDTDGSGSTASIPNSAGIKTISVVVKHKFTCSKGGDEDRDDSPSSKNITVMMNDTTSHIPPLPNEPNSLSALADKTFNDYATQTNMGITLKYTYNGTLTNVKAKETYPKEGDKISPQPCGQATDRNQSSNAGWKIEGSTSIPKTPIKIIGTIWQSTSSISKVYDIPATPFRKHFIQVHRQLFTFNSGQWGSGSTVLIEQIGGPAIPFYPRPEDISDEAASAGDYGETSSVFFGKDAPVECCPNA